MTSTITPDQAKARARVVAMAALVDVQEWEPLERCFAAEVLVDYSSLWGGQPQRQRREQLLEQWQALLPGFDATRHELGSVSVEIDGDEARATAPVSGTHLIGDRAWLVEGRYKLHLARDSGGWRIDALTYLQEREEGNRSLTDEAKERAKASAQR